ncbi:MAG: pitrilysin family protein, partial [Alphaproteobacteria bacterium]|nr:pitrilysin family protein [Alphaproteobacteria bacterium]
MSVTVSTLPNGLRVATDTMTTVETVSLGMWVGVGTRHEREAENGVSHLLEHMAFKGTERRTAGDIAREIEAVGGFLNAYTAREVTAYYAKVLKEDAALAVDILADILTGSVFDAAELERERTVILQEIGQAQDFPEDVAFDLFQETAYPAQAMGRSILGRPEVVRSLPREAVAGWMGERYRAPAMVLAAAGHIEHEELLGLAERYFADLPTAPAPVPEAALYAGGDVRERRDIEQSHLVLGFEGPSFREAGFYPAQVFSTLYGGGMSSRLFQEVREKRGLVYSIYSFASSAADTGIVGVYAGTASESVDEVLAIVRGELEDLAGGGPDEDELACARAQLRASLLMARESTSSRCEQLAQQ